jgi:hypothetical protein
MSSNRYRHAVAARANCRAAVLELGVGSIHASLGAGAEGPERLLERWRGVLAPKLYRVAGVEYRNPSV